MNPSHNPRTFSATPNLAVQKAQVTRSANAKKLGVLFTADEVRQLDVRHPVRIVYTAGGDRAVRAYFASQQPGA